MECFIKKFKQGEPLFKCALKARKEGKVDDYLWILKEGVKIKDPECIYLLAKWYDCGYKGEIKQDKAFKMYKKNIGHYKSLVMTMLILKFNYYDETRMKELNTLLHGPNNHYAKGLCYKNGLGTDVNEEKSLEEFLLSYEKEDQNDEAALYIGRHYGCFETKHKYAIDWFIKSAEQGNIYAMSSLEQVFYHGTVIRKDYEKALYWNKMYFKFTGFKNLLESRLSINITILNVDSLIYLHLARYYLHKKNEYLSWYFYQKTKEKDGKKELKTNKVLRGISRCHKMVITLLCIGKALIHPKEVFMLIAKELWKTRLDIDWQK